MFVTVAYHVMSLTGGLGHYENMEVRQFLREFHQLFPLVNSLIGEDSWSIVGKEEKWSALFFVEYYGEEKRVSLEMKPVVEGISVPSFRLDISNPPTLQDVEGHILRNLSTVREKETYLCDEKRPKQVLM